MTNSESVPHPDAQTPANTSGGGVGKPLAVPYTQLHHWLRRTLETAQDVVVILLMTILLVIALEALYRLFTMTFYARTPPRELLSEVVYILILTELYRTLIYYLREHRVSVTLMVEVAIVSVLRDQILTNAHELEPLNVLSSSVLLLVLGALLTVERRSANRRDDDSEVSAH